MIIYNSWITLLGTNTDIYGFVQNLKSRFPGWTSNSAPVAVIGSGGAARAVIIGLQDYLNVKNIKLFKPLENTESCKLETN